MSRHSVQPPSQSVLNMTPINTNTRPLQSEDVRVGSPTASMATTNIPRIRSMSTTSMRTRLNSITESPDGIFDDPRLMDSGYPPRDPNLPNSYVNPQISTIRESSWNADDAVVEDIERSNMNLTRANRSATVVGRGRSGSVFTKDLTSVGNLNRTRAFSRVGLDVPIFSTHSNTSNTQVPSTPSQMYSGAQSNILGRRGSIASQNHNIYAFQETKSTIRHIIDVMDILIPKMQIRLNAYAIIFFVLCLLSIGHGNTKYHSLVGFFFTTVAIDMLTAIFDHFFFTHFIDRIFVNHYAIAYLLHGFQGPLGISLTIAIMSSLGNSFVVIREFNQWDSLIAGCMVVVLCMSIKNWFSRRQYIGLLERRFSEKLFRLETWTILLSELATSNPPKNASHTVSHYQPLNFSNLMSKSMNPILKSMSSASLSGYESSKKLSTSQHNKSQKTSSNLPQNNLHDGIQDGDIGKGDDNYGSSAEEGEDAPMLETLDEVHGDHRETSRFKKTFTNLQHKVMTAFAELVDATSKYNDDLYEDDIDVVGQFRQAVNADKTRTGGDASGDDNAALLQRRLKMEIRKRKTFWELAARVSANNGTLKIMTYDGFVRIRRKFQAKDFGKSLFLHLSKGSKRVITHDDIKKIFHDHVNNAWDMDDSNVDEEDDEVEDDIEVGKQYGAVNILSQSFEKDQATLLYESAIELLDPFHLGYITEEQCMAALCQVYKDQRFAATSLNDYGELHQSLRTVVDVIFWSVMSVILQAFLRLDVYSYVLPFVTMTLTVSFALSSMLGNLFLSVSFVFLMAPFDIGNKIYIGSDPKTRIVGFVRSVALLYTTICTPKNELMVIPNHTLYHEKICNLADSGGAVFEIVLWFNLIEREMSTQPRVDAFFDHLKEWVLVDQRADWQGCNVICTNVDSEMNAISYSVWVTHRDNWQDVAKPNLARTNLMKRIRTLMVEMNLGYAKFVHRIEEYDEKKVN